MIIHKLHKGFFLLALLLAFQSSFGYFGTQQPQNPRQFDSDFKERYSGNKYNYEGVDIVSKTPSGSGEYEDYKKTEDPRKEEDNQDFFSINLGPLSWLFYLAIIGAVIFLVYILLNEGSSGLFSRNRNQSINIYNEITADNIEDTDIDAFILNAEKTGDYRLAIRYYYLLVLKHLSLKNHIKFEDDKTNSEYLNEIYDKPFSKDFEYTSYLYNYIWYGEFPLNANAYQKAKTNFATLLKQVN
ncbi:hypothetical protein GSB9_02674 [Flavobacteriaceae bacterium GSB9]|nr:hypothetical protein GSB9_02674 [Flavobacteriaceae bacterium GSB9]